jgi:hypothetical protein
MSSEVKMGLLLRIQGLKFKNWLTRGSAGDRIKAAAFAFLGLLFLSGVHWGFLRFLTVIRNVELVGDLLLLKILAMAFMTSFLMIVFSSTITSFSTLFFREICPCWFIRLCRTEPSLLLNL